MGITVHIFSDFLIGLKSFIYLYDSAHHEHLLLSRIEILYLHTIRFPFEFFCFILRHVKVNFKVTEFFEVCTTFHNEDTLIRNFSYRKVVMASQNEVDLRDVLRENSVVFDSHVSKCNNQIAIEFFFQQFARLLSTFCIIFVFNFIDGYATNQTSEPLKFSQSKKSNLQTLRLLNVDPANSSDPALLLTLWILHFPAQIGHQPLARGRCFNQLFAALHPEVQVVVTQR